MKIRLLFLPVTAFLIVLFAAFPALLTGQTLDDMLDKSDTSTPITTPPTLTPSATPTPTAAIPEPPNPADAVATMRDRIVQLAAGEVGKVSHNAGSDGFKEGWQQLCEYYRVAYRLTDLEKERPHWTRALKAPKKRIEGGPAHWCGIFCIWAWRTAGLPVYWDTRTIGCKYRGDVKNIQKGDICIIKKAVNPNNHHCVVLAREGNTLTTIDGNQAEQRITQRTRPLQDIEIFYSVADAMGAPLATPVPTPGTTPPPVSPTTPPSPTTPVVTPTPPAPTSPGAVTPVPQPTKPGTPAPTPLPWPGSPEVQQILQKFFIILIFIICGI
jgi:hypothetical protein